MTLRMDKRYCKPILRTIWNYVYNKNKNCIVGITGPVGLGKSITAVKINHGFLPEKKFNLEESLVYNVGDLIKRSLSFVKVDNKRLMKDFTMEDFKKIPDIRQWLKENVDKIKISRGRVIIFDETGAGAFVREFMKLDNRTMGKLVQLWRILGIVLIVVIPEDLSLADSIIPKFINIEILLTKIHKDKGYAEAIAWEYIGRNKKTKEPIRRRLKGCRYGGKIKIMKIDDSIIKDYEDVSLVYKLEAMVHMAMEQEANKPVTDMEKKSIWEYINHVKDNLEEFKNDRGRITTGMIRTRLGVSVNMAARIRENVLLTVNEHTPNQ